MKTIINFLKPFFKRMAVGFSIKVTATMLELALPYILSHILKNVVVKNDLKQVIMWGGLMIVCALLACICHITANRIAARVSSNFSENMRHTLFERTLMLSARQRDRITIPSLESRITSDTYNVHHFVGVMQRMGVRAPILLIGGVAITLFMDSFLALVMICVLPLIFIAVYFISKKGIPLYRRVQQSVDKMIGVVRETAQGIRVIKALSKTEYEHRRYQRVNDTLVGDEVRVGRLMSAVNPVMNLLMNIGLTAVVALSANMVAKHRSDPETVVAFMQYFTMISMAMMSITRIFNMFTKALASANRIEEVIQKKQEITVESEEKYPPLKEHGFIDFKNVSFSYNGIKNNVENISFSLKKGESLGIIGATGSGKSSVIRLFMRIYDADSGEIYVNGKNIKTIDSHTLYSMFGSSMQQDFLYSETVKENILFGRSATDEQVFEAAKAAQAHEFIVSFPEGYDRVLSQKATNISGGQKQRLLIARALLMKPQILVLDDSSSALDYKTDVKVRKAIKEFLPETTAITVAQRVSTIKDCDIILVLDEGKIIAQGTHEELLKSSVEYLEISESQMGGAFVD